MGRCIKSVGHPKEDLAKSGYKTRSGVQILSHPSIFVAAKWKPNIKSEFLKPFFLTSDKWKLSKSVHFFEIKLIQFSTKIFQLKNGCMLEGIYLLAKKKK
jgi:hypothetical protein